MGRAGDVGDEIGARLIAARLVHTVLHPAFMIERRWPPYATWWGSGFELLRSAVAMGPFLDAVLTTSSTADRQLALDGALTCLLRRQNDLGLTTVTTALIPFWDRPYRHPDPAITVQLLHGISDTDLRRLSRGLGAIDQCTANVSVLTDPTARRAAVAGGIRRGRGR